MTTQHRAPTRRILPAAPHALFALFALFALIVATPASAAARQVARPDSARRDTLETVVVRVVRTSAASSASQFSIPRETIEKRFAGEDAPLFLTRAPSVTTYSEAGGFSGYSYLRVRGIDQTRLNITVDGVPLNDPEDQVLYFSNVPDFLNSVQTVQLQRGVGASTFGTASYAGSLNFQTIPIATTPRSADVQVGAGSYGTGRASVEYATGMLGGAWAGYARASAQHTDGYRRHSGNDARSAFVSAGWFGDRDLVKFTGFAGISGTRLAYLAAPETDLALDRRANPLGENEGDRFHQEMASVQYTRSLTDRASLTATAYRNSAAGAFDVNVGTAPGGGGPMIDNFQLAHVWYGLISVLSASAGPVALDVGGHVSDYHREHAMAVRPNLDQREYANTGFKQEQSGFVKLRLGRGAFRAMADLQVRRAAFRYRPSENAGIGEASTSWTFVNPKVGVAWHGLDALAPLTLTVSFGRTSREPARGDLFAGADDLNQGNAVSILPLTRVKPETVDDLEAGAQMAWSRLLLRANYFEMRFRNEIAPIGQLSLTGNPLRRNVDRSRRRGVELEGTWRASPRLTLSGNLTAMESRIRSYTDEQSGTTYADVEPLQSPPLIANVQVDARIAGSLWLIADGRYVDRAHLANDGGLTAPSYALLDGGLAWRGARVEVRAQLFNVLDANAYSGGYTDGTTRYFYPIASRNLMVTTRFSF